MNNSEQKRIYGQFFTKEDVWLKKQVKDFIKASGATIAYDPFAGAGDLLTASVKLGFKETIGLDIDKKLNWKYNDSLLNIPHINNAMIITNPPYFTNYSASRKKVSDNLKNYFDKSVYGDLYLIALDRMLEAENYIIAIIPETFINSNYKQKNRLASITVLEENPFNDTDTPVLIACFDGQSKTLNKVKVYKNDAYVASLGEIESMRLIPHKNVNLRFNNKNGWLGVRCVDSTDPRDMLKFDFKENIDYDWEHGIKVSSRLFTLIDINIPQDTRKDFIMMCNSILYSTREKTSDIIFSPFKGNMKNGRRRRRLDFFTCRAIIEKAYSIIIDNSVGGLFGY